MDKDWREFRYAHIRMIETRYSLQQSSSMLFTLFINYQMTNSRLFKQGFDIQTTNCKVLELITHRLSNSNCRFYVRNLSNHHLTVLPNSSGVNDIICNSSSAKKAHRNSLSYNVVCIALIQAIGRDKDARNSVKTTFQPSNYHSNWEIWDAETLQKSNGTTFRTRNNSINIR